MDGVLQVVARLPGMGCDGSLPAAGKLYRTLRGYGEVVRKERRENEKEIFKRDKDITIT